MRKNNPIIYFYPFLAEVIFYFLASISQSSQKCYLFLFIWLKYTGVMGTNNNDFISTGSEPDMLRNKEPNSHSWVPETVTPRTWVRWIFILSAAEMLKSAQVLHVPRSLHSSTHLPNPTSDWNFKTSSEKPLKLYLKNHFFCSWKKQKTYRWEGQNCTWPDPSLVSSWCKEGNIP